MDAIVPSGATPSASSLGGARDAGRAEVVTPHSLPQSGAGGAKGDQDEAVADSRRNWSPEMLLELAKTYKRVAQANPDLGRMSVMQLVYDEFQAVVDCSSRSRKAVDDKLYSMKQMYHFIMEMNGNFKLGYRKSVPTWFELSKQERRVVRSLHRVRTPNISLEVFRLLDSVLNPNPNAQNEAEDVAAPASDSPSSAATAATQPAPVITGNIPDVVDAKRNWSEDVTLELAKAWNAVHQQHPELRGATLSQQVYDAFMGTVGFSNRSRKAVDDKMHSMREMWRFVSRYEAERKAGEDKPAWFELTKKERREIRTRHQIRVTNLSREVYEEIDQVLSRSNSEPDDDKIADQADSEVGMDSHSSALSSGDQATGPSAESQHPSAPASASFAPAPSAVSSPAFVQVASQPISATALPQVTVPPAAAQADDSTQVLPANALWAYANTSNTLLPAEPVEFAASTADGAAEPPAAKRRRTQLDTTPASGSTSVDESTTRLLCEQLRLMHEQDRQERRRQHAEQMAVLREIAGLLRQKQP